MGGKIATSFTFFKCWTIFSSSRWFPTLTRLQVLPRPPVSPPCAAPASSFLAADSRLPVSHTSQPSSFSFCEFVFHLSPQSEQIPAEEWHLENLTLLLLRLHWGKRKSIPLIRSVHHCYFVARVCVRDRVCVRYMSCNLYLMLGSRALKRATAGLFAN